MRTKVLLLLALAAIVNGAPGKLLDFIMNVTSYHAGSSAKGRQGSL